MNSKIGHGNLVLLDIFSYSCMNCLRSLEYIRRIDERYSKYGLNTILIHPPEWKFEKNKKNVVDALKKYDASIPVIIDKDKKIIKSLEIDFWPTQILLHNNQIAYKHIGEGNYKALEEKIRQILGANPKKIFNMEPSCTKFPTVYLGKKKKGMVLKSKGQLKFGSILKVGKWIQTKEYLHQIGKQGSLTIITRGSRVYAVARAKKATNVQVMVDNKKDREITINRPCLYLITKLSDDKQHQLKLTTSGNLEVYSFAFE